jgi:predicted dehydrogenase
VGLNRRFMSSTSAAKSDLESDPGPRFIHVQDQQSFKTGKALGYPQAVIGNWMYGNSIHVIDYFHIFGHGEVTKVTEIEPWRPEAPGLVLSRIDFSSGDVGLYQGLWHAPGPWACTVITPRRRWELRPLEKAVFQNAGERNLNAVDVAQDDTDFKPGFRRQAQGVISAARNQPHDVPDLDEATRTMRLIASLFGSHERRLGAS